MPSFVDVFLAICQGLGLALAVGIGGLLVPLLASVLAHIDVGWTLDGTDWDFLASEWFIAVLFALNVAAFAVRRHDAAQPLVLAVLVVLGALLFAGSLAEEGTTAWPGLIAGALAAGAAALVARDVLAGAARRQESAAGNLALLAACAGLILVLASLFLPPVSIVALAGLVALAVSRRRQEGRKYAGLRILR